MSSTKKLLRQEFVDALKLAGTLAGDKVYNSKADHLQKDEMPGILVYTTTNPSSVDFEKAHHGANRLRSMMLSVQCVLLIKTNDNGDPVDNYADEVDDFAHDVDRKLVALVNANIIEGIRKFTLTNEITGLDKEGGHTAAANTLTYEVEYIEENFLDGSALDEFLIVFNENKRPDGIDGDTETQDSNIDLRP